MTVTSGQNKGKAAIEKLVPIFNDAVEKYGLSPTIKAFRPVCAEYQLLALVEAHSEKDELNAK